MWGTATAIRRLAPTAVQGPLRAQAVTNSSATARREKATERLRTAASRSPNASRQRRSSTK
jgi:hypothetical protein